MGKKANQFRLLRAHVVASLFLGLFLIHQFLFMLYGWVTLRSIVFSPARSVLFSIFALTIILLFLLAGVSLIQREGRVSHLLFSFVNAALNDKVIITLLSSIFLILLVFSFSMLEIPPYTFVNAFSPRNQVLLKRATLSIAVIGLYSLFNLFILSCWDFCQDRENIRNRLSYLINRWVFPILFVLTAIKIYLYFLERSIIGASPDIYTYMRIANDMTHPFDTDIIEPVWIWLVKMVLAVSNAQEYAIFTLTSLIFLGIYVIVYRLVADLFNKDFLAELTALLILTFDVLFETAAGGVRDNFYLFGVLGFIYTCFVDTKWLDSKRRVILSSIFFTIAVGTRITSIYPLIFILLVSYWKKQNMIKHVLGPIIMSALVLGPYLYVSYINYGDAMISSNIHARWIRNYEFIQLKKTGCDGCPSLEDYNPLLHQGDPISTFEYIFKMHTLEEVIKNSFLGFVLLYFSPSGYFIYLIGENHPLFFLVYLTGLFLFFLKEDRFFLLIPIMLTNFLLFTMPFYMPARYLTINSIFFAILIAYGIIFLVVKSSQAINWGARIITVKESPGLSP